jgi:hypothetical protein
VIGLPLAVLPWVFFIAIVSLRAAAAVLGPHLHRMISASTGLMI